MKGRIISVFKDLYRVSVGNNEINAPITGNMIKSADFPVVGDYVEISDEGQITEIYPRKTILSRKVAGKEIKEQPIVSNVDFIFIVTSLNKDFNIARLERYLTMVYESGSNPCFILTKSDLDDDVNEKVASLEEIAFGVPIHVVSSYEDKGIDEIRDYLKDEKTIGLIGSSGVGKSTLINKLLGNEIIKTKEIRVTDDKGKHTTTRREMFKVGDGYIIDTPGMREIQIWSGDTSSSFEDVEELAKLCRFSDCTHGNEPGCAVNRAIETGELKKERLASYLKLKREIQNMENKINHGHKFAEKEKIKNMMGTLDKKKKIVHR
ncbi:ribosome small subunit-dependent GTPase A [Ilyobacter sp.]|uniref:ribosome small subunit-dependent GTPase A n=1 Tax=Ilyobacter sp. TaxID=3100343 RepID=UPI0035689E2D